MLHGDYSKYGTSVYDQLYGEERNKGWESYDQGNADSLRKRYRALITASKQKKKRGKLLQNLFPTETKIDEEFLDINCLPDELICRIVDKLDDRNSELSCLYVSRKWYMCARRTVYRDVQFLSTYRAAQFVTTLRETPEYGSLVRSIDLSHMRNGLLYTAEDEHNEYEDEIPDLAFAGWRDWRYRKNPLYGGINRTRTRSTNDDVSIYSSVFSSANYRTRSNSLSVGSMKSSLHKTNNGNGKGNKLITRFLDFFRCARKKDKKKKSKLACEENLKRTQTTSVDEFFPGRTSSTTSALPFTNKFLLKYAHLRDLPMGHVLHLLTLCVNLEKLDISNLTLSSDFEIEELNAHPSSYGRYSMISDGTRESEHDETIMDIDGSLPAKYFSDSDRPYHYYKSREDDWFSAKSQMFCNHHPRKKKFQLRPLSNHDFHQKIVQLSQLQSLTITNVVWLMQRDMRDLVTILFTKLFLTNINQKISVNFSGSGMQLHSPLANRGDLQTMIALAITSQLISASDENLVTWFQLRSFYGNSSSDPPPSFIPSNWLDDSTMLLAIATQLSEPINNDTNFLLNTVIFKEARFNEFKFFISPSAENFSIVFETGLQCTNPTHRPILEQCLSLYDRIKKLRHQQLLQHAGENYHMLSML